MGECHHVASISCSEINCPNSVQIKSDDGIQTTYPSIITKYCFKHNKGGLTYGDPGPDGKPGRCPLCPSFSWTVRKSAFLNGQRVPRVQQAYDKISKLAEGLIDDLVADGYDVFQLRYVLDPVLNHIDFCILRELLKRETNEISGSTLILELPKLGAACTSIHATGSSYEALASALDRASNPTRG